MKSIILLTLLFSLNVWAGKITLAGDAPETDAVIAPEGSMLNVQSADLTSVSGTENVNVETGENFSSGNSGSLNVLSGSSASGNTGGVTVQTGTPGTSGTSGGITLSSGPTSSGNSGAVTMRSGTPSSSGMSGDVTVTSGDTSTSSSGFVFVKTGDATTSSSGTIGIDSGLTTGALPSGAINIQTGTTVNADSGNIILATGTSTNQTQGTIVAQGNLLNVISGIATTKLTGDPCADAVAFPESTLFYNDTSDYYCFCNGSGVDVQFQAPATACF